MRGVYVQTGLMKIAPLNTDVACVEERGLLDRQPAVQGHEVDLRVGGGLYGGKEDLGRGGRERGATW